MEWIKFSTLQYAIEAKDKINSNITYPKKGRNAATGKIEEIKGLTSSWDTIQKAHNQDLWYFKKPCDEYMLGVINYEESEFDNNWIEEIL